MGDGDIGEDEQSKQHSMFGLVIEVDNPGAKPRATKPVLPAKREGLWTPPEWPPKKPPQRKAGRSTISTTDKVERQLHGGHGHRNKRKEVKAAAGTREASLETTIIVNK